MIQNYSGRILVHLGSRSKEELPRQGAVPLGILPVNANNIY